MITVTEFQGERVAVFGLGRSGLSAIRALIAGGAEVLAGDDRAGVATRSYAGPEGVVGVPLLPIWQQR